MFTNENLQNHLETSSTIRLKSATIAEWNMNIAENIALIGNYRYRPNDPSSPEYNFISQSFSFDDTVNRFYTDATDADVVVDGGLTDEGIPLAFISKKEKEGLLYSLEDCFGRFRPRSGINKLRYFDNKFSHFSNIDMTLRPRYYMADKNDDFKYWTSYRTENGLEKGVANIKLNGQNVIHDAAPFVVYKKPVPANRIVVKMQTNVGEIDLGPFVKDGQGLDDPFFGKENQTTPIRWKVQYLDQNNSWIDASSFDENSVRVDGSPIIGSDGYLELFYGISVPEEFLKTFKYVKTVANTLGLPDPKNLISGTAYIVQEEETSPGTLYIAKNNKRLTQGSWLTFNVEYGWSTKEEQVFSSTGFVNQLVDPDSFINPATSEVQYREFSYVYGLRVVIDSMNVFDSTFDLIELSPRLSVDLSDKVNTFTLTKSASDLGITGLPVGQLLASVGSLSLFDYDQSFSPENKNSIVADYTSQNIQFKFYEVVGSVESEDEETQDFFVPMKTMYSEGFPEISNTTREVSITLRDLFFYFESFVAPQILITSASLSYAVSLLLDAIGFSNYTFLRNESESEEIIPFFFVGPDQTLAEVLNQLAISTQSAMFFDEFNNFIVMSKGYILPTAEERPTSIVLRGSKDFEEDGVFKNKSTSDKLSNIIDVSFMNNSVFNNGVINYTTRSIQRSYGTIRQASLLDRGKTWVYKPVLLWEVAPSEATRSINDEIGDQSEYALTAIPLNSNLTKDLPAVENHRVVNNTMDLGDGVYWTARFDGYFFANGEIIRYDAIQFSVPGLSQIEADDPNIEGDNVWITSSSEYQRYFSKIPFNGKMYPTGLIRIYSEPHYEVVEGFTRIRNGFVAKHGRGQFGTQVVDHEAGLSPYWSDINSRRGLYMDFKYLVNPKIDRVRFTNVTLQEESVASPLPLPLPEADIVKDTPYANLIVEDASLAKLGDYVSRAFNSEARDPDGNLIGPPTRNLILNNARIIEIEQESNVITIDRPIEQLSDEDFSQVFSAQIENIKTEPRGFDEKFDMPVVSVSSKKVLTFGELFEAPVTQVVNEDTLVLNVSDMENFEVGLDIRNKTTSSGNRNLIPSDTRIIEVNPELKTIRLSKKLTRINPSATFRISLLRNMRDFQVGMDIKNKTLGTGGTNVIPENSKIVSVDRKRRRVTLDKNLTKISGSRAFRASIGSIVFGAILVTKDDFNSTVYSIATQEDGSIILGGTFETFNGFTTNRVVRITAEGRLDEDFAKNIGQGANDTVKSIAVQSDGKIVLVGNFTSFNGITVGRIVRLNADGTRDVAFTNNLGTGATGSSSSLESVALQSDGKILVGGTITTWSNVASINNIVRLNESGTRDTGFSTNVGTAANGPIKVLTLQSDQKILLGGDFAKFNEVTVNRIARLNTNGTRDTSFSTGNGANKEIQAIAVQSDGKVIVGGDFTTFSGATVNRIVRLNANGSRDTAFTSGTGAGANGIVNAIAIQSDGKILVAGSLTRFNNTTVGKIALLNANGTVYSTFRNNTLKGFDSVVRALRVQSDDKILAAGTFAIYAGVPIERFIRLESNGLRDIDFISNMGIGLRDPKAVRVGLYVKNSSTPNEDSENVVPPNTRVAKYDPETKEIILTSDLIRRNQEAGLSIRLGRISLGTIVLSELRPETVSGPSGIDGSVYTNSSISGVIKNHLANQYLEEGEANTEYPATIQSSALVFKGNVINTTDSIRNYISYVYKPLEDRFKHFGTRMRIIGRIENSETRGQIPEGSFTFYTIENTQTGQAPVLAGGSGGLAVMVNPNTNEGYYFEIVALTENNLRAYSEDDEVDEDTAKNILFYKIQRNFDATVDSDKAIPVKLFSGIADIIVDTGDFVGQGRLANETNPTVYDLAIEYKDNEGVRTFYLYINNVAVAIVKDENPLPIVNNMAMFVRGNSKCMFENAYALTENYSQNTSFALDTPINSAFGDVDINAQSSFQKYSVSGLIQSTYLSGISTLEPPKYNIFFEEFGTIMREAAYFNVRYDKAFPSLYAKIAPTFNRVKGFTVAGFFASAYGAEFLVFNHTDTVLNLDSSSGNYLRILGVTFTQQSVNDLTVDDYLEKKANFADPQLIQEGVVESPVDAKKYYTDIKLSRLTQGNKEFTLDGPYIQSKDSASRMMKWLVEKIMKPRKSVGVSVFGLPILQLGDVVEFDYRTNNFNQISEQGQRFVIYNIEYSRSLGEVSMNVYLSEVPEQ
jgi:uncharacterized delta-60 repeat protein